MKAKTHWRWASQSPTVPILPGVGVAPAAFLPLIIWAFHWAWLTFYIAIATMIVFIIMAKMGFNYTRLTAWIQNKLRGKRVYARPWWYRNHFAPPGHRVGVRRSGFTYDQKTDDE
jgi:intracellular multiplication protein IcmT